MEEGERKGKEGGDRWKEGEKGGVRRVIYTDDTLTRFTSASHFSSASSTLKVVPKYCCNLRE